MDKNNPPICPNCGKLCWRPGRMLEMAFKSEDVADKKAIRPATMCMWCLTFWSLEKHDGVISCHELRPAEAIKAEEHMGEMRDRKRGDQHLAKMLGLTYEQLIERYERFVRGEDVAKRDTKGNA